MKIGLYQILPYIIRGARDFSLLFFIGLAIDAISSAYTGKPPLFKNVEIGLISSGTVYMSGGIIERYFDFPHWRKKYEP
jgi:hypothetical protein